MREPPKKQTTAFQPLSLEVQYVPTSSLKPDPANARKHPQRQIAALKAGISHFGFTNPILIDEHNQVLAGHARLEVAQTIGLSEVPTIRLAHLSDPQKRALALADNKLGDLSEFDPQALIEQLQELCAIDFDVELTGFSTAEIDILLETPTLVEGDPADDVREPINAVAVSQQGDLWQLDRHRLVCGNALEPASYEQLLAGEQAGMVFTDPPYNVPIAGHVSGLGKAQHREFAMASGEMSSGEFTAFLEDSMNLAARYSCKGSVHYWCMDWRHLPEILDAGASAYSHQLALCVWNKSNAGMGSLYRSQHELVLVFKNGTEPHVNNVQLGSSGRYRTNVWDYPGANAFGRHRDADLAAHPTVKPVALVADAIRDCSRRGDLVLDPFAGSGTILLAAERTGRRAAAIELDPLYVDVAIQRWQQQTGKDAVLVALGQTFDEVRSSRLADPTTEDKEEGDD